MEPFLYDLTSEEGRDALIESLEATLAALEEAEQERSRVLAALDSTGISRMTLPTKAVKAAVVCQECVKALRTGKGWMGSAAVRVATLNVVDRDGDLIVPGALEPGPPVIVSDWNHDAAHGLAEPVGIAQLEEVDDALMAWPVYDDTPAGRRACARVLADKPDWSVTYRVTQERAPTAAERAQGCRRVILRWEITEVSAVAKGAGVATGTCEVCCGACDDSGSKQRDARIAGFERSLRRMEALEVKAAEGARDDVIRALEKRAAAVERRERYAGGWAPDHPRRVALEEHARELRLRDLERAAPATSDEWEDEDDLAGPPVTWPSWGW